MSSSKKGVDLLVSSLEKESGGCGREWELLACAVHSNNLWNQSADSVLAVLKGSESPEVCPLHILNRLITHSSTEQLQQDCSKWVEYLTQQLQKANDVVFVDNTCKCLSTLLDRCRELSKGMSDFTSRQLPAIMTSLLWFAAAAECLQCIVLPVVTKCVLYYPKTCAQFKGQLTKWVNAGLFLLSQQVSQECSRLLVLVHSSRSLLMESVTEQLHAVLSILCGQDKLVVTNKVMEIPPFPTQEPGRSALLLRVVCVLCRTISYWLLLTEPTSVDVSLERLLGVIVGGLELKQQLVTGLSYDQLLLYSILPVVHSCLLNLLITLIQTCHTHLLPYTTLIESCIVQALTSDPSSEALTPSVHQCLSTWVSMRKDTDNHFITRTTSALIKTADSSGNASLPVQLSALAAMSVIVRTVGVLLPPQVCAYVKKLVMKGFSLATPPERAAPMVDLLLCCVSSSNAHLHPNNGTALAMLSMGTKHQSEKVRELCKSALAQCELIRHPAVPPIVSAHTRALLEPTIPLVGQENLHSGMLPPPVLPILSTSREQTLASPLGLTSEPTEPTVHTSVTPQEEGESEPRHSVPVKESESRHSATVQEMDTSFMDKARASATLDNILTTDEECGDDNDEVVEVVRLDSSVESDDEALKLFVAAPPDEPMD